MAPAAKKNVANPGLTDALARPENKACADCGVRGASWASVNLGVFVCMECAAIHRKIGVHISVVKSTTLDTWKPKWIETCTKVGNRIATDYYEHKLPVNFPRPGQPGGTPLSMEEWIRSKYERMDYASTSRGRTCPTPGELVSEDRNPDDYSREEEQTRSCDTGADRPSSSGSGNSQRSDEREVAACPPACPPADSTGWATFKSEDTVVLDLLMEYYARVGRAKSRDQLNVIVERFKGREETLYKELEKKYAQPVRRVAAPLSVLPSSPLCTVTSPSAVGPTVIAAGILIPDVFQAEAEVAQRQQTSQEQQINCLNNNLSALYQQSAPVQPVLAANGANYSDLMNMQPSMEGQQVAWMQQMSAMQQMAAMQQTQQMAAMQQTQQMMAMQQMQHMQQMQQGFGAH